DPTNFIPIPTTFNKTFNVTRVYGIGWNLTKSLSMDIDATNLSTIDEPAGRVNGLKVDTLWQNLLRLGRTTNYNHTLNFNYTVPLNKIPGMIGRRLSRTTAPISTGRRSRFLPSKTRSLTSATASKTHARYRLTLHLTWMPCII